MVVWKGDKQLISPGTRAGTRSIHRNCRWLAATLILTVFSCATVRTEDTSSRTEPRPVPRAEPVVQPEEFDAPPEPIHRVAPEYPDLARQAGIEGVVVVRVIIRTDGSVASAKIVDSDVNPLLGEAAVDAALQWRFEPARRKGNPVPCEYPIPIYFSLWGQ
jgi:protein TonB